MTTSVRGLFKGLRYITQIFDEDKDHDMQIGFPTDVKHIAHIGSDGPVASAPSWMKDFKPEGNENGQVVSRGETNTNPKGEGVGLQELLPLQDQKPNKQKKTRRNKSEQQNGSPPRRHSNASPSDIIPRHSRRHSRSRHGSMDSSNDPSMRRRRSGVVVSSVTTTTTTETSDGSNYPHSDSSAPTSRKSTSRPRRKQKGSIEGESSMRKAKAKVENSINVQSSSVDKCNDYTSDRD